MVLKFAYDLSVRSPKSLSSSERFDRYVARVWDTTYLKSDDYHFFRELAPYRFGVIYRNKLTPLDKSVKEVSMSF